MLEAQREMTSRKTRAKTRRKTSSKIRVEREDNTIK